MKPEHIILAMKITAQGLESSDPIAQALRSVVARAERYEAQEPPPWQPPVPPLGAQWHRSDGWTEADLPDGFRPLMAHEMDGEEHDDIQWKPSQGSSKWQNDGSWHAEGSGWFRTQRP